MSIYRGPESCPARSLAWAAGILCGLILAGCRPASREGETKPAEPPRSAKFPDATTSSVGGLGQELAARDQIHWSEEVAARAHEAIFVRLADDMRRSPEPAAVLAELPFDRILVPRSQGDPTATLLAISSQGFSSSDAMSLSPAQWKNALSQFREAGWSLRQFGWQHERFEPQREGTSARSQFSFQLHGEQVAQTNRFILRGSFLVEWAAAGGSGPPQIHQISLTNLSLLERAGAPGFSQHALIAPEPERPGDPVNLHPLIVIDLNGDGHEDVVLPGVNKVLLNDGQAHLRAVDFVRPEDFYPLQEAGVIADFTGDGRLDFLGMASRGPWAKKLVLHAGAGVVPLTGPPLPVWEEQGRDWPRYQLTAASVLTAGDIDGDGDLDVFVAQYRPPYLQGNLPTPYYDANDGYASYLLLNDGHGYFHLAPTEAALGAHSHRRTLAASLIDLDNDQDLDLITINDFCGVDLYFNDGHGQFSNQSDRLSNRHLFGMGFAAADFDRDGTVDLLAIGMDIPTVRRLEGLRSAPADRLDRTRKRVDMAWGNRVYLASQGKWTEPPWAALVARTGWSWGTSVADFDNNGALDIYIANGHVSGRSAADYDTFYWTRDIYLDGSEEDPRRQTYFDEILKGLNTGQTSWHGYEHNVLFLDLGANQYVDVAWLMGVAHETDGRAVVSADLNEDGRPDLLLTEAIWQGRPDQMRHRLAVHLNQLPTSNHWIGVRLQASALRNKTSPIGAKVQVRLQDRILVKPIVTGDSFQAQHPFSAYFGLGSVSEVAELKIIWPNGHTQVVSNPAVDRYHTP